jgi:hypothetical protein
VSCRQLVGAAQRRVAGEATQRPDPEEEKGAVLPRIRRILSRRSADSSPADRKADAPFAVALPSSVELPELPSGPRIAATVERLQQSCLGGG